MDNYRFSLPISFLVLLVILPIFCSAHSGHDHPEDQDTKNSPKKTKSQSFMAAVQGAQDSQQNVYARFVGSSMTISGQVLEHTEHGFRIETPDGAELDVVAEEARARKISSGESATVIGTILNPLAGETRYRVKLDQLKK